MTVSKNIRHLIKKEYIESIENQKDTRAKTITLTLKGKSITIKSLQKIELVDKIFLQTSTLKNKVYLTKYYEK